MRNREELDARIRHQLRKERARFTKAAAPETDIPGEFSDLLELAHRETSQPVVLLIDEYDKPTLDNLLDPERARWPDVPKLTHWAGSSAAGWRR